MTTNSSYIFFLGGMDLEMVEIRKMLEARGLKEGLDFFDRNLPWGAKLSDYQDLFSEDRTNVCVELSEDVAPPEKYKRIDHHNELSDRPASISQIADLFGLQLNRWQQLIAANDSGYIPAMQKMGASKEEISKIRLADRRAQGVREADEAIAVEEIKHKKEKQGVTIVKTTLKRFSPITDRLFGTKKLLVWNGESLNYYGEGKEKLVKKFAKEIAEGKAYHGGGPKGYFGTDAGAYSEGDLGEMVEILSNLIETNK